MQGIISIKMFCVAGLKALNFALINTMVSEISVYNNCFALA